MVLTATATQGFEHIRQTSGEEIFYLPGNPGDTFTRGDGVYMNNGVCEVISAGAAAAEAVGTVARTTVCPAATTAFPRPYNFDPITLATIDKTLIPVKMNVAAGVPVYRVTFSDHQDDTVISYTAGTRALALTTGMTADDYPNGAMLYVYDGTGAGQLNVVEDYDHTGGAAELLLICHRIFDVALDSTSKIIVVSGEAAASRGVEFIGRIDAKDGNELQADDGANDGDFAPFCGFVRTAELLSNLTLEVIPAQAIHA